MLKNKKGFTLIELVMIIVILGILAAVAVPRYISLQQDANTAAVQGVLGAVSGASAIVHAKAIIDRSLGATGTVTAEGTTIDIVFGYPAGTAAGIAAAIGATPTGFTFTAGSPATFTKDGAATPANCSVSYTAPAAANTAPVIVATTTGC